MPEYILPVPIPPDVDYSNQAAELPGTRKPGQTGHYRSTAYPFLTLQSPEIFHTVPEIFEEGLRRSRNQPFLGHRPVLSTNPVTYANHYVWESYASVDARRRAVGSALHKYFQDGILKSGDMQNVGIWSANRPDWEVLDLALQSYRKVSVALYDTLGKDSVGEMNHAEVPIVFASLQHIPFLLRLAPRVPHLRIIVSFDPLSPEASKILSEWGQEQNIQVMDFAAIQEIGRANLIEPLPVTYDDIATICYTSGTTGNPKGNPLGVLLSHGNVSISVYTQLMFDAVVADNVVISYLPLAHVYERIMMLACIAVGSRVGFSTGDPLRLLEDMQILKPTFVATVPRVLNRIYQLAIMAGSAPGLKGALFRRGMQVKLDTLHATGEYKHAFWDRLVFNKVSAVLGGRVALLACGSAPISAPVMDFMRIALGACILEAAYGMTENCGTASHVWPMDPKSAGTVGPVLPCNDLKLIDVPSMGYSAEDKPYPRGEMCMRGDNHFKGYYKDPVNTKSTIDEEGWVHTGDVAMIDECGRIKIIDRVKNIMKLAQGEYVALESIENVYSSCPLVAQLFVYGDSLQSYLIAVVVVDPVQFAPLLSKVYGKTVEVTDTATLAQAVKDPQVNSAVLKELAKVAAKEHLKGFEMVKRIHVTMDPFSVDNGCLTPTFKVRRKETYAYYKKELDALYALGEPPSAKL
ncbi:acetyl-CoA synthetase-like protein [Amylocystis lapponica]|nr:acetyl-CoA synthetase-like protein [Amylocystis lapponica]